MANMRILYANLTDLSTATITVSSTASASTTAANLQTDIKSKIWRSATMGTSTVKQNIIVNLGAAKTVGCIALPFTNLTSAATITVKYYATAPTTNSADPPVITGTPTATLANNILCCPWNTLNTSEFTTITNSSNTYGFGGGTYAVVWFTPTSMQHISIEITDTRTGSDKYIEASRLVVGSYWVPKYNASLGVTQTYKDTSEQERTEAGDLYTKRAPIYNSITFDLKALDSSDRQEIAKLMISNGITRSMLVSIFPENGSTSDLREQERVHMILGKLVQTPALQYFAPTLYTTTLEIAEV